MAAENTVERRQSEPNDERNLAAEIGSLSPQARELLDGLSQVVRFTPEALRGLIEAMQENQVGYNRELGEVVGQISSIQTRLIGVAIETEAELTGLLGSASEETLALLKGNSEGVKQIISQPPTSTKALPEPVKSKDKDGVEEPVKTDGGRKGRLLVHKRRGEDLPNVGIPSEWIEATERADEAGLFPVGKEFFANIIEISGGRKISGSGLHQRVRTAIERAGLSMSELKSGPGKTSPLAFNKEQLLLILPHFRVMSGNTSEQSKKK